MKSKGLKTPAHALAAFAALFLLAAGCGSHESVVGKWTGTTAIPGRADMKTDIEFKADGTSTVNIAMPAGSATETASYTTNGNTFTITPLSATLGGQTRTTTGAAPEAYSYVLDGDRLTLTQKGGARIILARAV